jgi:hypothetical protein
MSSLTRFILFAYRSIALFALYAVLVGVLGYVGLLGFYAVNTTWIAPTTVHPTDENSLGVIDRLVTSQNSISALSMDREKQQLGMADLEARRRTFVALQAVLSRAIHQTTDNEMMIGQDLETLGEQKQADNARTDAMVQEQSGLDTEIRRDLAAGLITKSQAIQEESQLNDARNGLTDGKIAEVALRGSVLEKTTPGAPTIEAEAKRVDLQTQIATLDTQIVLAHQQIDSDDADIARIQDAIGRAKDTPYFLSTLGNVRIDLAFVPFDNEKPIAVGAPVYDCYLSFLVCRYAGSIRQVFPNEEKLQNPIFRTDMRGFLVQLDLRRPEASRSRTLFVGGRPLGI